jgi:hypothetical protein
VDDPLRVIRPRKFLDAFARDVGVNAKTARPRAGVVFLTDVRVIHVANLVLMVERDEQSSVADRDIAWHVGLLSGPGAPSADGAKSSCFISSADCYATFDGKFPRLAQRPNNHPLLTILTN